MSVNWYPAGGWVTGGRVLTRMGLPPVHRQIVDRHAGRPPTEVWVCRTQIAALCGVVDSPWRRGSGPGPSHMVTSVVGLLPAQLTSVIGLVPQAESCSVT